MKRECTLTKDGEQIKFDSLTEASKFLGIKGHSLKYYANHNGYHGWKIELGERIYAAEDISGMKFGRLTAIRPENPGEHRKYKWLCQCDCGKFTVASKGELKRGIRVSCGCARQTHGMSKTRLHTIWNSMNCRCRYPQTNGYKNYGGRGIKVCDEWAHDFECFAEWALTHGYEEHLTLDRIDVDGDYCPDNCRWVTQKEQANHTRFNHYITCDNVTHTLAEWSEITGLSRATIFDRLQKNQDIHDVLFGERKSAKKPLVAIDETRGIIYWFESSKDAERRGFTRAAIWRCLRGEYKTHKGCTWQYAPQ